MLCVTDPIIHTEPPVTPLGLRLLGGVCLVGFGGISAKAPCSGIARETLCSGHGHAKASPPGERPESREGVVWMGGEVSAGPGGIWQRGAPLAVVAWPKRQH